MCASLSPQRDTFGQQFVNHHEARGKPRIMPSPPWVCSLQMSSVPPPYGPPPPPGPPPEEPQGYQPFDSYYRPQPPPRPQNARRGGLVGGLLTALAAAWAYGKYVLLFA